MRITIGGSKVFSRRYRSFDEFMDEYVDHMNERGRRVPDYDVSILLTEIALWLLGVAGERAINELIDALQRGKEEEEARELEASRHSEVMAEMKELRREVEELQRAVQDTRGTPPGAESVLIEDSAATASALLRWAKKEYVRIDIVLETEAEGDLKEAFEALTKDVPGSTTGD